MTVLIFTFGGREVRDENKAAEIANVIMEHGTKVGSKLSKVILVTGKPFPEEERRPGALKEDPKEKAELVKTKLVERGVNSSGVEIKQVSPNDFKECLLEITNLCRVNQNIKEDVILNVAGGTKEISFGAINAAWMLGLRAFHLQYKGGESAIVELPIPTVKYLTQMSSEMKEYLVVLLLGKGKVMTSNSIQNVRGIKGSTMSGAIRTLISERLVRPSDYKKKGERKHKIYSLTDVGEWYAELSKKELESTEKGKERLSKMENEIKTIPALKT